MPDLETPSRTFFRIVTANPPTEHDFRSHQELGRHLFDPSNVEEWRGVSVYGTLRQAQKKARDYPSMGQLIAELEITEGSPVSYKRTGRAHSHYTLPGPCDEMVRCVVAVWHIGNEKE